MGTKLAKLFSKEPKYLNIYYDTQKLKLVILEVSVNEYTTMSDDLPNDENLNLVFILTPYLIGMLRTLNIPFYKVKRRILSALNKDLKKHTSFNKNTNLYNVLVNEFGIRTA
jgi:hypothetical protein